MFDYHLHTTVSFDGIGTAREMAKAAKKAGLKEICFTDHMDYSDDLKLPPDIFTMEEYQVAYDELEVPGVKIRKGVEFGLTIYNTKELQEFLAKRPFDFVIGSVHYAGGMDPYCENYWVNRTAEEGFRNHLEVMLKCVKVHEDYDVLGHLTYAGKSQYNPTKKPIPYDEYRDLIDEILRVLVTKGKGIEINTSGVDRIGAFLPTADIVQRFHELGGEIVTVGSDAHNVDRVGQYCKEAIDTVKDIFGYVCTFENRKPIFHKL